MDEILAMPFAICRSWWKKTRLVSHFGAAERAATAVEFAMVAPIFIGLLISVIETGIFMLAQNNLQAAAVQAGRYFLTGQAQTNSLSESQLINDICPELKTLFTCANLMVDVQSYSSFNGANTSTPTLTYNAQGQVTNSWNYNGGTAGSIVVLRLMYQWPVVTGPLAFIVPNLSNGSSLIMGVTAFRVEPYAG
jgi:Flp pilus assembly protein TadG